MKLRNILSILLLLTSLTILGQGNKQIVFPSSSGIIIKAVKYNPAKSISYKVERTETGKDKWKTIDKVSTNTNFESFSTKAINYTAKMDFGKISSNSLKLAWNKIQKNSDSVFFTPYLLASGCYFLDETVVQGTSYQYRIKIEDSETYIISENIIFPQKANLAKLEWAEKEGDGNYVQLSCLCKDGKTPTSFSVYKQIDISKPWLKINVNKGIVKENGNTYCRFVDSEIKNQTLARYVMVPIDEYGNYGNSSDTITVTLKPQNQLATPLKFAATPDKTNGSMIISWKYNDIKDFRLLHLYRSKFMDTLFTCIADLNPSDTTFTDLNLATTQKYYYYIEGTTWTGEKSLPSVRIFGITDNITPPATPRTPKAETTNGGVKISWKSQDPYVRGYYVFRANGLSDTLKQISNLIFKTDSITSYIDSSANIVGNKSYAYSIKAESKSYISSQASEQVLARPGKAISLLAPKDISISKAKKGLKIFWQDMTLVQEGIQGYDLYRRIYGSGKDFEKITKEMLPYSTNFFIDSTAEKGINYEYACICLDFYGNKSGFGSSGTGSVEKDIMASPVNIRAFKENTSISIEWDEVMAESIIGYRIYKQTNNLEPIKLSDVDKNITEFKDSKTSKGEKYRYWVVCIYKGGLESGKEAEAIISLN